MQFYNTYSNTEPSLANA